MYIEWDKLFTMYNCANSLKTTHGKITDNQFLKKNGVFEN